MYFGRESESGKNVVVKVPLLWGKPSFDVERHVNSKLRKRGGPNGPWAEYLGSYKLRDIKVDESVLPVAMAWKREEGRTLREYLDKSLDLHSVFNVQDRTRNIRPALAEQVLGELLLAIARLHRIGIMHRDIKPDNVLLCPAKREDGAGSVRLLLIDFGSSLDVRSPRKVGWSLQSLDPNYAGPEIVLDWRHPRRYDVYAAAMTALRVLCPSLATSSRGQENFGTFAKQTMPAHSFDLCKICEANAESYDPLALELRALSSGQHPALLNTLAALLRQKPGQRATAEQALRMLGESWARRLDAMPAGTPISATAGLLVSVALSWPASAWAVSAGFVSGVLRMASASHGFSRMAAAWCAQRLQRFTHSQDSNAQGFASRLRNVAVTGHASPKTVLSTGLRSVPSALVKSLVLFKPLAAAALRLRHAMPNGCGKLVSGGLVSWFQNGRGPQQVHADSISSDSSSMQSQSRPGTARAWRRQQ